MDMSWLAGAGQAMLPQSVGTAATTAVNNKSWLDAFSGFGDNIGNIGSLMGGAGSLYGAYNAKKLGDASLGIAQEQNDLVKDKYKNDQRTAAAQNSSFGSVWG